RVVARAVSLSSRLLSVLLSVPTRRSSDLGAGQGDRGVLGTFPGAGERAVGGDHFRCRGSPGDLGVVLALGWQVEIIDRRLGDLRSEEHTSELQSRFEIVRRSLLEE